jgi:hypothetical protein
MRTSETEQQFDAGDAVSVKERERRAKVEAERRKNGLKQIMSTADGRLWMWNFLSGCGLFAVGFTANASKDAFALGMRNSAMPIFADIQRDFMDDYLKMVKENS